MVGEWRSSRAYVVEAFYERCGGAAVDFNGEGSKVDALKVAAFQHRKVISTSVAVSRGASVVTFLLIPFFGGYACNKRALAPPYAARL